MTFTFRYLHKNEYRGSQIYFCSSERDGFLRYSRSWGSFHDELDQVKAVRLGYIEAVETFGFVDHPFALIDQRGVINA